MTDINTNSEYFSDDDALAFTCATVLVSLLSLAMYIALQYDTPVSSDIMSPLRILLEIQSTTLQKISFLVFVGSSAIFILFISFSNNYNYFKIRKISLVISSFTALAVIVLSNDHSIINGYKMYIFCILGAILLSLRKKEFFLNLINKFESLQTFNREKKFKVNQWLICLLLITFIIFWFIPFFYQLHISTLSELIWIDSHYAVTMLGGYELASDGSLAKSYYGLGMPLIVSSLLKLTGGINGVDTNIVLLVKLTQMLLILIVAAIFYFRARFTWPFWMLLVMALTMFTLSNFGIAIGYPNQSGLRFLPIVFSLLLISFITQKSNTRYFCYLTALICSFTVLLSPETGIILVCGVLVMLFFSGLNSGNGIKKLFLHLIEFCLFFISMTLLLCVFITPIFVRDILSFSDFIFLFGKTGYGGLKGKLSLTAAIFLIFGLIPLISAALKIRARERINSNEIWRVLVATVMLLWHSYYFNRMAEWNLWFNWILFVILISSYFAGVTYRTALENLFQCFSSNNILFGLVFVLIVSSLLYQSIYSIKVSYPLFLKMIQVGTKCEDGDLVIGLCLKGDAKDQFRSYTADVRTLDKKNTIVLSELTTITRLDGFNKNLNFYTPYDAVVYQQIPILKNKIEMLNPKFIAWHTPDSTISKARGAAFDQQIGLIILRNKIDQSNINVYRGLSILQR